MNQVIKLYTELFKYLDANVLWTNRVIFVSLLLIFLLKLMGFKNIYIFVIPFFLFFTLVVNVLRFNPVIEDLTIDYNISIENLSIAGYFSHNNYEGLRYITQPIADKNINELGIGYSYITEDTISMYSTNRENWDFPNPNFVNSLSDLLKNFNQFSCKVEIANSENLNIQITDDLGTYSYCFDLNE